MKKIFYILFILGCFSNLFGQKKVTVKQANKLFERKAYVKAAEMYEQLGTDKEVLQNLGDSYFYNFQMLNAVRAYGQLFFMYKDSLKPEVFFRYANALKGTSDFEKGDAIMSEYLGFEQNTPKFMKNITRNSAFTYKLVMMSKNKRNGDFGISFYGDKVAFASLRNGENATYGWNERPYLDLFSASVNDEGLLVDVKPFSEEINTKTHESSAVFTSDLKTMYFNRTGEKQVEIGNEKYATVKLYKAEFVNGKWTNVMMLPFSSDEYSVQHPALSKDGKQLYFASDMKGTIGSFDIFVVDINEDGTYSQPRNLGENINTIHREQFPFVADDGSLYFASDGHQGHGNLDVFMSYKISDTEFDKPQNLGLVINSEMDDFNLILDYKTGKGYFSSNRTGDDNLYTVAVEENKLQFLVEGEVRDKNSLQLLPGTVVKLFNEAGELVEEVVVGKEGTFTFNTEPDKKYKIMAFKDFYIPAEAEFETSQKGKVYIDLQMRVESYSDAEKNIRKDAEGSFFIELENIYFDLDKSVIKPQAAQVLDGLVALLKKYKYMEIEIGAHTDTRASEMYNLRLSNRRAASALEYLVQNGIERKRLRSIGYGESRPLIICPKNDCTDDEHATNRRCTFRILK
ncbi:OmpA family protein [Flavobacterium solisilvae]|uniref:OmpA family protein n=1 Tax=Flavobacterium solisilvae TaxID=1852019 RepID=A0ABX1QSK0_9FLAO|nr:OmpA family protein [Flavobacterium solisilvae]NMH24134.1 OmpA family protein [Flavobacterium solisilvae]